MLMGPDYSARRDDVGLSPVSVVSHCVQATPPGTVSVRSTEPSYLLRRGSRRIPEGFGRLGSVAYRPGRNVTPPELLLPGPSVSVRCRPLLAA